MLVKILGYVWTIAAILLLIKPQVAKDWLQKNRAKKNLWLLPLVVGILLIYVGLKYQGFLASVLVILGVMGVIKAALFLNAKIYNKMIDWSLSIPIKYYRIGACFHIAIGLILLSLS